VRHAGRALLLAGLVHLGPGATIAAAELRLDGAVIGSEPPAVRVVARNVGTVAAVDVTPAIVFEHRNYDGAPAAISPGGEHEWRLSLPPSTAIGTSPAIGRVAWHDAAGAQHSWPLVVLVPTPGAPASPVTLAWANEVAAPVAHTRLTLENHGERPVAGRVVVELPGELAIEPQSQPVAVPANATRTVPLAIESRDAPSQTYPAYAVFTYTDGGRAYATLTRIDLVVGPSSRGTRAVPLAVGGMALALVSLLLLLALRTNRRTRAEAR
jgi:hypothetical protein